MSNEPEKVWISFDQTIKPTDPPGYWPKGWPAVFRQPRDSGVPYIRARSESGMVLVPAAHLKQQTENQEALDMPDVIFVHRHENTMNDDGTKCPYFLWLSYEPSEELGTVPYYRVHADAEKPDGMVLVPREPTDDMKNAGAAYGLTHSVESSWADFAAGYYRVMIAAAQGGKEDE